MQGSVTLSRRLPPLNSLKCFEAAGRLLSFTRAADELNVTQAAVSHQIKIIEEYIGTPLFVRFGRNLALSEEGSELLPVVARAFAQVAGAVDAVRDKQPKVRIRLPPSFAANWLSPRLHLFRAGYPDIELSFYHGNTPVDFDTEDLDLAVTYGNGDWGDVKVSRLLTLSFFPVCCPGFMTNDKPLTDIENLRYYTLLHDSSCEYWSEWLKLTALDEINPNRGILIDDTNVLTKTVIDGQGVAMGSEAFVQEHLVSGRLVKPFDIELRTKLAYYLVCPTSRPMNHSVNAFMEWLITEGEEAAA